jgi:glucose/arabinose dehydrogenase
MKATSHLTFLLLASSCFAPAGQIVFADDGAFRLVRIFENLPVERPVALAVSPDGTKRNFLVQQRGQVRILPKDEAGREALTFLDLSGRKMEENEQSKFEEGLNGFAFHPGFAQNGKFYVYFTQQVPRRAVVVEMQASKGDPNKADPASERLLLEVTLPRWWHHSGNLAFGPDGMLYISIGDGGSTATDTMRWSQDPFVMNGKVLRIDVDHPDGKRPYGIPADNPLAGRTGVRPEIYASGFRNPWGMSFDAEGSLWLADVGQELWEEINLIEKGGNYGWSFREGPVRYWRRTDPPPPNANFMDPIFAYDHTQGISITGGYVYRGEKLKALKGAYIYGDWGHGRIWALKYDKAARRILSNDLLFKTDLRSKSPTSFHPTAFCEDADHELMILDWAGKLFRLAPNK